MNWGELIANAELVEQLPPDCFKINVDVDVDQLTQSFYEFINRLGYTYDDFIKQEHGCAFRDEANLEDGDVVSWSMNLRHLPELVDKDRWAKHRGTTEMVLGEGVHPAKFSKLLSELDGLYIGTLIDTIITLHEHNYNRKFVGVVNIGWVVPGHGYEFHTDNDLNLLRYHIPLITNNDALWLFNKSNQYYKLHMPLGTVWKFNPLETNHTVRNNGSVPRAHLIITEIKNV